MSLLATFGDHSSYTNRDINFYIKSYMDTLENAELTVSIRHIVRFLKSGIPIYNSEVPDTAGRKTRRGRRTQARDYVVNNYSKKLLISFSKRHNMENTQIFIRQCSFNWIVLFRYDV